MKITSIILCFCILTVFVQVAFAQDAKTTSTFKVNALVNDGKKAKEVGTKLVFSENFFSANLKKNKPPVKEFNYADIIDADYSYSEKPILSTGGAIAATFLLGLWIVPLLFIKKKQHWLSVRTKDDFVVMRLNRGNYRRILNEFANRKIAVKNVDETSGGAKKNIKKD